MSKLKRRALLYTNLLNSQVLGNAMPDKEQLTALTALPLEFLQESFQLKSGSLDGSFEDSQWTRDGSKLELLKECQLPTEEVLCSIHQLN